MDHRCATFRLRAPYFEDWWELRDALDGMSEEIGPWRVSGHEWRGLANPITIEFRDTHAATLFLMRTWFEVVTR